MQGARTKMKVAKRGHSYETKSCHQQKEIRHKFVKIKLQVKIYKLQEHSY